MTLTDLYELTGAEFGLSDFRPVQETSGAWTVTAARRQSPPPAPNKSIVGSGSTEEAALRDLRLQWVVAQYGDHRG